MKITVTALTTLIEIPKVLDDSFNQTEIESNFGVTMTQVEGSCEIEVEGEKENLRRFVSSPEAWGPIGEKDIAYYYPNLA